MDVTKMCDVGELNFTEGALAGMDLPRRVYVFDDSSGSD